MVFGLFKKKKKTTAIELRDLDEWIKRTLESKNLGMKIGMLKREINSKKIKIKEMLQELEEATFKDESVIPERAKSIFLGNKKSYIQKVTVFLDNIIIPEEVSQLEDFLEKTSLSIEELAKETNKNFFIIKEFAEDEARSVAGKLKELDDLVSSARASMEKTSLGKFKELKKTLTDYHSSISEVDEIKKKMESVLEKKAEEMEKRKKIESKILVLKKSSQCEEYNRLVKKKEAIDEEIKKSEYSIINMFSGISAVLKKYSKKKKSAQAKKYSDNSVTALLNDDKLQIIKILEDVKKVKDTLDVKDAKLKKLDADVSLITKEKLEKTKSSLLNFKQEQKDIETRLKNHPHILNLKEQEGKLQIINSNISDIENEAQEIENVLERINPRLIKQRMKLLVKEIDEKTELI